MGNKLVFSKTFLPVIVIGKPSVSDLHVFMSTHKLILSLFPVDSCPAGQGQLTPAMWRLQSTSS